MKNSIIEIKAEILNATNDSKHIIAQAALDAAKVIAQAAADAKTVITTDAAKAVKVSDTKIAAENSNKFSSVMYKQISLGLSILAVLFGGFIYLTSPAKDNDTALQLQDQRITSQQKTIDGLNLTQQNDTKELKNEVAGLRTEIQAATNQIIELKTIIQERLPLRKQ